MPAEPNPQRHRDLVARLKRLRVVDQELLEGDPFGAQPPAVKVRGPQERYRTGKRLGQGGMGDVVLAREQGLERTVALKRLRADRPVTQNAVDRFIEEARVAARLEHPNIVPVYDLGVGADGLPFFTMKWIRGRSLAAILLGIARGDAALRREFPLARRVQILQAVCMAVDFAHSQAVIHRDLKPANVVVGKFGEVHVVDWGIASVAKSIRKRSRSTERVGAIQGTLAYMAPEQARGEVADARTDVFGLGAILFELLTLRPPRPNGSPRELLKRASAQPIAAASAIAPEVPPLLDSICQRALALAPSQRHDSARALHDALLEWLEGSAERERRRRAADRAVASGVAALRTRADRLAREREFLRRERRARASVEPFEPLARKRSVFALERDRERAAQAAAEALAGGIEDLQLALRFDPDHREARARLGALHASLLQEAEDEGRVADAILQERLLRSVNDGGFDALLQGSGRLSLDTSPRGALVVCWRYEEENLVLRPTARRVLGRTPLRNLNLPRGSYLVEVRKAGFEATRCPVLLRRGQARSLHFPLLRPEEIGAGFIYVPAGPAVLGGDPRTLGAWDRHEAAVPGFLIARFPVTFEQYLKTLNLAGDLALPRDRHAPGSGAETGDYLERARGRFVLRRDGGERAVHPRWPVFGVSWADAQRFIAAQSRLDGVKYRLPLEREWEKAARGADGRWFPWGNRFDATLCKMAESRATQAQPEPIGTFKTDSSPYGVRDMAGGIQEWTADWLNARNRFRVVRGGAYSSREPATHAAYRTGAHELMVYNIVGLRLAKDLPR